MPINRPTALTGALLLALHAPLPHAGLAQDVAERSPNLSNSRAPMPAAHRPDTVVVTIRQFRYEPDTVRVRAGDVVVWRNADQVEHTVTADAGDRESPLIKPGREWSVRFTTPGRYAYHCLPHPFMKVHIHVQEATP